MPADDCPTRCKAYPYCGCGQERRFGIDRSPATAGASQTRDFVIWDNQRKRAYRSWVPEELSKLVELMNKLTGVSS